MVKHLEKTAVLSTCQAHISKIIICFWTFERVINCYSTTCSGHQCEQTATCYAYQLLNKSQIQFQNVYTLTTIFDQTLIL